jgi:putative ABC transport system permease protein
MSAIDLLQSLRGAFAHRMRAALTLLGIVIGTGSIILLASLIHGGESYLMHASQEAEDSDVIEAYPHEPPAEQAKRTSRALSRMDADSVAKAAPPNVMVAPEASFDTYALHQGRRKRVAIVSTGPSTLTLYRLRVAIGRELDTADSTNGNRVCIVGAEVYEDLLRNAPLVADSMPLRIEVAGHLFSVVGVLAKKPMLGNTDSTYLWDRKVLVPETTYDALHSPSHEVNRIYARGVAAGEGKRAMRSTMTGVLLRRHLGVLNFELNKDQSGGTEQLILTVIQILLVGAGVLALLASGINIMNVMLVTVAERRREIGLRRAIGATPRSILVQFLLEATALSLIGALIGVAAGVLVSFATAWLARAGIGYWELAIPSWSIGLGLGLAVVTGLVFGILPAWRAARVSPIDALRAD